MNRKQSNQVTKEAEAVGFVVTGYTKEGKEWGVCAVDPQSGIPLRWDTMEQWRERKAEIEFERSINE